MDTQDFNYDALILAAGTFPSRPALTALLRTHPRIICCDGAAASFAERIGRLPWRVVGDLDSLPPDWQTAHSEIITHESEQETNDLSKAMRLAAREGLRRIAILGATGKREDHTLGNISLLIDYMQQGFSVVMLTDFGVFIPCSDEYSASLPLGTPISVFAFGAKRMRSQGLRYPLYDFSRLWQGTLNSTSEEEVRITCKGDFLIYRAWTSSCHGER